MEGLIGWAKDVRRGFAPSVRFRLEKYGGWTKAQPYEKGIFCSRRPSDRVRFLTAGLQLPEEQKKRPIGQMPFMFRGP
jgi:hypothetical protein